MWTFFRFRLSLEDKRGLSLRELICPFCIMFSYRYLLHYGLLFHFMIQFLCLFYLFCKNYMKRENAGNWNSGPERSKSEIPILHNSKCPETLRRIVLEYIKNIGRRNNRRGPIRWPQAWGRALPPRACGPPGHHPVPIFCYMRSFDLEKIIEGFRDEALPSRGGTWAEAI